MEINNTKAYAATLNTVANNKPPAPSQVAAASAPADKISLSPEALALASKSAGDATVQADPPGWPPIDPPVEQAASLMADPPGWPPVDPSKA